MGQKFSIWQERSNHQPQDFDQLVATVLANRQFEQVTTLDYGDYGLEETIKVVSKAIRGNKKIALYADYDVDGTMSAVSWIWFLRGIGYHNFIHYIPCRFREGYGVNLKAVKHLIDHEGAELIITMDTGITANEEAAYCKARGVNFICTDHHKVQREKMPDCIILNPKLHPDPSYQELCGCGVTFVLLRKLSSEFPLPKSLWTDILALTGMATICDVVPLNGVNHRIAKLGVEALFRTNRSVLRRLLQASSVFNHGDEKDIGFRLGPRINAVGRLEHADAVIEAFIGDNPDPLINYMGECNERRKQIQQKIFREAAIQAEIYKDEPVLFLGGDWHPGVVGIAASKIAERFWRPTWLFNRAEGLCKGSARSIPGFDVTDAMAAAEEEFVKFGGHKAAGGFSFEPEDEAELRRKLILHASQIKRANPELWESRIDYDCSLPLGLLDLDLAECLQDLKPFGHGFEEPRFRISAEIGRVQYYNDKQTGEPKHSAIFIKDHRGRDHKVLFFNEVIQNLVEGSEAEFVVTAEKNTFKGTTSLSLMGVDWQSADFNGE